MDFLSFWVIPVLAVLAISQTQNDRTCHRESKGLLSNEQLSNCKGQRAERSTDTCIFIASIAARFPAVSP